MPLSLNAFVPRSLLAIIAMTLAAGCSSDNSSPADDPCDPNPCSGAHQIPGSCSPGPDDSFTCDCDPGHEGPSCEDCSGGYHRDGWGGCAEDLPPFLNGIDENTYLARGGEVDYYEGGTRITADLPYAYFGSKGVNAARIRVWVGADPIGDWNNAVANLQAAQAAGLRTLLAVFFSEQWSDNWSCDDADLGARFRGLSYDDKKDEVGVYVTELMQHLQSFGLTADLYAVGNEVTACVCGEKDRARMAELLNLAYATIRTADPDAKFVFHSHHHLTDPPQGWPFYLKPFLAEMLDDHDLQCDYLSTSFYPLQYTKLQASNALDVLGDIQQLAADLFAAHGKQFIISEWGYPNTPPPDNWMLFPEPMTSDPLTGYPITPQGQAALVHDLLAWGKASPAVAGIFYWGPMDTEVLVETSATGGWMWLSFFDEAEQAQPAIEEMMTGAPGERSSSGRSRPR